MRCIVVPPNSNRSHIVTSGCFCCRFPCCRTDFLAQGPRGIAKWWREYGDGREVSLLGLGLLLLGGLALLGGLPLLDDLEQGGRVGADVLVDLLAVLEDVEGGHGADAVLLREVGQRVDVDLGEVDRRDGLGPPVVESRVSELPMPRVCLLCIA